MNQKDEAGVIFEIPDFKEEPKDIFEIPDFDVEIVEPPKTPAPKMVKSPLVKPISTKPPSWLKIEKTELKKAPTLVESNEINYQNISEFAEYPKDPIPQKEKKAVVAPVITPVVIPEKPKPKPSKTSLWNRIVNKIPVDKDGKLALKSSPPVSEPVVEKPVERPVVKPVVKSVEKPTVKIQIVNKPVVKIPEPTPAPLSVEPTMDDLFEDTDFDELEEELENIEVPVETPIEAPKVVPPVVVSPVIVVPVIRKPTAPVASLRPIIQITEEPAPVVPVVTPPIKTESSIFTVEKPKISVNFEIKKIFKDAITTRKVPVEPVPEEKPTNGKRSYVERKFSPLPKVTPSPPLEEKPSSDTSGDDTPLPDPVVEAIRRKPLPPVKMAPKETFFGRLKKTKLGAMISRKKKERKRTKETGLTPRQRIKRYNSIHEGGYGMMEDVDDQITKAK